MLSAAGLRYVTREFRYAKAPREIFARILSRKGEVARDPAPDARGRISSGRYLPEFGHLTCLVQHEYFHRYTADEHTLVCIDKLDALRKTEDPKLQPYRKLFETISDPYVLYLALLLHDTGKGVGRATAFGSERAFCARRGGSSCSSRRNNAVRSSSWSIITSRSPTWRSNAMSMIPRR